MGRSYHHLHHLAITLLVAQIASAQEAGSNSPFQGRQSTLSGGLELNAPIGEFNDVWGRNFWGFSANFTYPARRLPFDYGFDFAYAVMGRREAKVYAEQEGTSALLEGDITVKCKLYSYMGMVRLRPINGRVSPYIEGMLGTRQFTTRSDLVMEANSGSVLDRKANAWTGAYGWAVGTLVGFGPQFYVEGRVERLWGGRVSYVDPNSIDISTTGQVDYGTLSSATDVVNVHLGVGLRF